MNDLSYLLSRPRSHTLAADASVATMRAVVTRQNGGFEQLDYCQVAMPQPDKNEVLIRVLAAGVNNTEINTRLGWYSATVQGGTNEISNTADFAGDDGGWNERTPFPLIQGTDCCGEIVAVGSNVKADRVGHRVLVRPCMRLHGFASPENIWMASDFDGAFAEYVVVPAAEAFTVNSSWTDAELGTIPCAYGTAENMLERAQVSSNDVVLITGASGGVGSAAVQLAKRRGAKVIGIVSKAKIDQAQQVGVDVVLEREQDPLDVLGEKSVSVIVDNVGGEGFSSRIKLLNWAGRFVSSGAIAGALVQFDMRDFYLRDLTFIGCTAWDECVFPNLIKYIESNEIKPMLAKTFALRDIVAAQQEFLLKKHFGKIVLIP